MKKFVAAICVVSLGGCASNALKDMTAEQIKAMGKDGTALYSEIPTPWGPAKTLYFNIDKGVVIDGEFNIDMRGNVTFKNSPVKKEEKK